MILGQKIIVKKTFTSLNCIISHSQLQMFTKGFVFSSTFLSREPHYHLSPKYCADNSNQSLAQNMDLDQLL